MTTNLSPSGDLNLGHLFAACGLDPKDVLVVRHTYNDDGLRRGETTFENVLAYTREQRLRFGANQPRIWLNFLAEGGRRCRFWGAFENHGEVVEERTDTTRSFDLGRSDVMVALTGRLVTEWSRDPINWAKPGATAAAFPVVEIADPQDVAFPGFDRLVLTQGDLRMIVEDSRYAAWRTALGSVQGVYLIADTSTGEQYVGKADGGERILGRWMQYAQNGHGGNVALRALAADDTDYPRHFIFSLLRVFGPDTPAREVDEAEAHFKRALLTREHGMNRN
ncbi:GIY-YIG nuclease family protein [Nocardioides eburneiflavus]|uniref:GIY-YIG nuclease family protein n=1 Tax=Nocardioides eburneiflavus TaxID=2518372 RepID=UPI001B2FF414|nr:GIY-YIG nuclease family protein [Nocardioides eburneiflavus]